jgi:pantoate--beta-alanine ligase
MRTVSKISALQKILNPIRNQKKIGFVPTMGAFHEGHLSLMRKAKAECGYVVVSLFVNPTQFGPNEDFKRYPRTPASDKEKAESAAVDLLWTPSAEEMYPAPYRTFVEVEALGRRWEGASRPGHFRGVATVVAKLLQAVRPDRLYLGRKDYQQTRVIGQMIRDLHFDTAVRLIPTLREADGLAMSSRNQHLSPDDRKAAPVLYSALRQAKRLVGQGERHGEKILKEVESVIRSEPRASLDYVALCDPETLEPVDRLKEKAVLLLAVKIGPVRLIDNLLLRI